MSSPQRVLVTGGAGFIGSHIVNDFVSIGHEAAVLDDLSTGFVKNLPDGTPFFPVDLRDADSVKRVLVGFRPARVVHFAAQSSVKVSMGDPGRDVDVNLRGGVNLLEAARHVGVEQVVFASSGGAIYGDVPDGERAAETHIARPMSPYGAAKLAFETYLEVYRQNYNISYTSLRLANVFGPRQDPMGESGVVAIFSRALLRSEPVTLYARSIEGDEGCVRDYVYVTDVAKAVRLAVESNLRGVYNVGSGGGQSTIEVLRSIAGAMDVSSMDVRSAPPRVGEVGRTCVDPSKIIGAGWTPDVGFEDGIAKTVEWFRERHEITP